MTEDGLSGDSSKTRSGNGVYRRILLKVSGESLCKPGGFGFDKASIQAASRQIALVHEEGIEVAVVTGGGNIIRGAQLSHLDIDRGTADYMGMLGTAINALALQGCLESMGYETRVLSAIRIDQVVEPYIRRRAMRHLEKGRIIILAAGTGNPFVSTDTAAALRARELGCDVILKGTKVGGIYDKDPMKHHDAERIDAIDHLDAINRQIAVMDHTALTMCREADLDIIVFNILEEGNILKVIRGEGNIGTRVSRHKRDH
ncbi:MAG TPA: UMP kinase [Planctomycetes bacterium]|nr:UMP kinase [Planctomycetota bacterium]